MNKTIGFIGCGNMAQAIIGGVISSGLVKPKNVISSDMDNNKLNKISDELNINITNDNKEVAKVSDILVLAVKPHIYNIVIKEIKDMVKDDVIIVIIAAGKNIKSVEEGFNKNIKVVRTMPNTPALVGEGMTAMCFNNKITDDEKEEVINIFESFGKVEILKEDLIDFVPAVSGSSPAYVFMFIEAMADAAVLDGIPREKAYNFAAQAVLGAAKMVLETGKHPGELKDMVCSPKGTTIEAVAKLEEMGLRNAVISAMRSCSEKSLEMLGKK